MSAETVPEPTEICRQDDIRDHPERYMGLNPSAPVRCVGRFGLSMAMCTLRIAVDSSLVDDTFEAVPLANPLGCIKARLDKQATEGVNPRYL